MTRKANPQAAQFLASNPGLADALAVDHRISADLARRLNRFGSLSVPQVNLARKIAAELSGQASGSNRPVDVPSHLVGETAQVTGRAVSYKWQEWRHGRETSYVRKVLLTVSTPAGGTWKLFVTAPKSGIPTDEQQAGDLWTVEGEIERLEHGFAVMGRPTLVCAVRASDVRVEAEPVKAPEPSPEQQANDLEASQAYQEPIVPLWAARNPAPKPSRAKPRGQAIRPSNVADWLVSRGFA